MSDASHTNSPAKAMTPMELDVNAKITPEPPSHSGSTDFQNPNYMPNIKQEHPSIAQFQFPQQMPAQAAASSSSMPQGESQPAQIPRQSDLRMDAEMSRREKTLAEFLGMMDNYTPIIPDAVTDYYLGRTGFDCDDVRIKRLLALATQKFISDIATDAYQYCKVRQSGNRKTGKDRKAVLTMEDLSAALAEYGVNVKKPDYYT